MPSVLLFSLSWSVFLLLFRYTFEKLLPRSGSCIILFLIGRFRLSGIAAAAALFRMDDFRRFLPCTMERLLHPSNFKVDCRLFRFNGNDADRHFVTDSELFACMLTDHHHLAVVEAVIVICHVADMDESFYRVFEF